MIVDYSFWGLNDETMKLAPEGAMQFGTAPLRIREALMKANPEYGPVFMYKNDMSDGFIVSDCQLLARSSLGSFYRYFKDFHNWSHYLLCFQWVGPKVHHGSVLSRKL